MSLTISFFQFINRINIKIFHSKKFILQIPKQLKLEHMIKILKIKKLQKITLSVGVTCLNETWGALMFGNVSLVVIASYMKCQSL